MAGTIDHCVTCHDLATKRCVGCANVSYCSLECEEADRIVHEQVCHQHANFQDPPSPEHRLAILLPEIGTKASFFWVAVGPLIVPEDSDHEGNSDAESANSENSSVADYDTRMGEDNPQLGEKLADDWLTELVCGRMGFGQHLSYSINVHYRKGYHSPHGNFKVNECLKYLSRGKVQGHYKGPLVLLAKTKVHSSCVTLDMDPKGFSIAVKALVDRMYRETLQMSYFLTKSSEPIKTKGVRVRGWNVISDIDGTRKPTFEEVDVPLTHPIFSSGKLSDASVRLSHPMLTYLYPAEANAQATMPADEPNVLLAGEPHVPAAYLHLPMDLPSNQYKDALMTAYSSKWLLPQEWRENTCSVLVARRDKEPIDAYEVERVCTYCSLNGLGELGA